MKTPSITTSEYPTRYVAHDNPGFLVEHVNPQDRGGFEFAVYHSENLYIEICSYQGEGMLIDVSVCHNGAWNRVHCERKINYQECRDMVDKFVFPPLF